MDSVNTSIWTNDSRFLLNVLNYNLDLTTNNATQRVDSASIAILIGCVLGLPGNLSVIAVYILKITTSTKVYIFALAVTDYVVCVCVIVLSFGFMTKVVFIYIISISATYSMGLLVFMSIERLTAVRRPHSFNMDPLRAKKAVSIVVVPATMVTIVKEVAKAMIYNRFDEVFEIYVILSSIGDLLLHNGGYAIEKVQSL